MAAKGNQFPKKSRLYLRNEIARLFEKGSVLRSYPFNAHYVFQPLGDVPVRMGIAVPKKKMKRAVDRNRIKRLVREAFRTHHHELSEHLTASGKSLSMMVVFSGNELPDMNLVKSKIILILHRLSGVDEANRN